MTWHNLSVRETAQQLEVDIASGLSEKQIEKREKQYGKNQLISKPKKSLIIRFLEQFSDFMIITLIAAAAISFLVSWFNGHMDFVDPIIILLIITLNAILGIVQESKAEHSLEALKQLSAPTASVLRSGEIKTIDGKELVPGDIIFLEAGHFIPADARLLESINLKVEESSLTGESHSVEKDSDAVLDENTLLGDRKNMVMSSGVVTYGRGKGIVTATGMDTEVGHIATLIMDDSSPETPLQKRLAKTGKILGIAALCICLIIFIIGVLKQRNIFDMFMTSVSLAVAAIPEGLPAIVTIMLSLGVQRMAKKNAVIRKLPAVETLGNATVICSDKTGTLTQNKMTVTKIASSVSIKFIKPADSKERASSKETADSLSPTFTRFLLTLACLCNDSVLQIKKEKPVLTGEPTENALVSAAFDHNIVKTKMDVTYPRIHEIPFDSGRKRMTSVHKWDGGTYKVITKGAPDLLLPLCTNLYMDGKILPMTAIARRKIEKMNLTLASDALRVIGVAYKDISSHPKNQGTNQLEHSLIFVGLLGMIDPPREEVRDAVATCKLAGIRPVMITGDHGVTACAIGKELGIGGESPAVLTGQELSLLNTKQLEGCIDQYSIFARVSPEHKVRIVKALQNKGEVVAMTGDGINDAPALKAADIGCAMGITGTDVAKNASDMILTDDNFATIVSAVKEGRGIYENIKKAVHFLLSCNIGEIITIFIAILFDLPSPLLAVQLLWVNLVTDSLPAIALGVEPVDKDIMTKKPIPIEKGFFDGGLVFKILSEGILIGSLALIAFVVGVKQFGSFDNPTVGRTMAFAVLSLSQLFHSFNMRSEHSLLHIGFFSNTKLLLSFLICTFLQVTVISSPFLAAIFKVVPLSSTQWGMVAVLSMLPILVVELQKMRNRNI